MCLPNYVKHLIIVLILVEASIESSLVYFKGGIMQPI